MAETRTEPTLMKFLHAITEAMPHRLSDDMLKTKTTPIKKYEIKKVRNLFSKKAKPTHLASKAIIQCFFTLLHFVLKFVLS